MAEPFDTLMQVQTHDITLDQLRHRLATLPERSELADIVRQMRRVETEAAQVKVDVDDLTGRQRLLEQQIEQTAHRRHDIERRMRSGDALAGRDLQVMDHEVNQLAVRQTQLEEEEIELLELEEPLDALLAALTEQAQGLAVEAARLKDAIIDADVVIHDSIAVEEARRSTLAVGLPPELAEQYERLRSHLGGVGAARLVGDRCDGCHLTLSSVEIERVRHLPPDQSAVCPQCDRILVR